MPRKTPEEIAEENRRWLEKLNATRFTVDSGSLPYEPDEKEVFFYTPSPDSAIEDAISSNYPEIRQIFEKRGMNFIYLPVFNREFGKLLDADRVHYHNPKTSASLQVPAEVLTFRDIGESLKIPPKVDGPCFIRCMCKDSDPLLFSFSKIALSGEVDILSLVRECVGNISDRRFYCLASEDEIRRRLEGKPADERFDTDVYLIGQEIRERIERLRLKGLSTLAIRKLIDDDADKPGKLLIDRQNRLILTDYGNREIKLEPLQKAVFFLFLKHPEGILFKDLPDYREELGAIYMEITGRGDLSGIEDSLDRLTDPFNNSINEKCARIKNAFVSEFREEVASWYFIDGKRGEPKAIRLPRELVIREDKD